LTPPAKAVIVFDPDRPLSKTGPASISDNGNQPLVTKYKPVINRENILTRVKELGQDITIDLKGHQLLVVSVLNGAFIFTADLVRAISLPLEIDFIRVASYDDDTNSSGNIRLSKDLEVSVKGRDILLVEDIIDTGRTAAWLKLHLGKRGPASIRICALIDKQERREENIVIDYCGFKIPEGFLIGYGLDHAGQHRQLPEIQQLIEPKK